MSDQRNQQNTQGGKGGQQQGGGGQKPGQQQQRSCDEVWGNLNGPRPTPCRSIEASHVKAELSGTSRRSLTAHPNFRR